MREKKVLYCEVAFLIGMLALAVGTAFMEKANFGMSMIVAPAYILHLKVSQFLPFFTFGVSEYVFQACLLTVLSVVMRKVKKRYFLSFVTAFTYGILLDGVMIVMSLIPFGGMIWRIACYLIGLLLCTTGVALLFHSYLPPEAYELFVKEVAQTYQLPIGKVKVIYDCCSCIFGIALSLLFFGTFIGVSWGTVFCAAVNGWLISQISRILERQYTFKDALQLRDKI